MTNKVSIIRYDSDKSSRNSQITLQQNLFSFLLEGEKGIQYAGTGTIIKPDQFYLLSCGNCLMSEKIAAAGDRYRSMLLFFDNELLADFFSRHQIVAAVSTKKGQNEPFLVFGKDAFLTNFIDSLGLLLDSGKPLSADIQKVKLEELLLYLSARYPETIQQLRTYSYQANNDLLIREIVTANIDNTVTVEQLAFLCHMSVSTFKRRFAGIYNSSPNKWLLEKRMQKAADLLKNGKHQASEINYELGYENLSGFIQSFKKIHGITPKQYQLLN
ncbi:AraC family transcriptional regulator [Mucilaginibacter sp. JRF]|uniref:helix-turn-helix domain-containing protein n=1 Tax=Mucilaginibacter sp. JRF TaxID=2780088 RepID=UPI001D162E0E|nr:AraC family transcriptional regulator [Mucilaginibacter sp. JRF]